MVLKLSRIDHLLFYADDNLLGDGTDNIKKNTRTVIDASKGVNLDVSAKQTKYMLLYCHQNAKQNHGIKMADRSFGNGHISDIWGRQ